MFRMEPEAQAELHRQLDQLDPQQLADLAAHIRALPFERRAFLDRIAAHLATRLGRPLQPQSGAVYARSHVDASGRHDGVYLEVVDRPGLSGFVSFAEWVYLSRKAAAAAIEQARVHVGAGFNTAAEIRAMRDAVPTDGPGLSGISSSTAPDLVEQATGDRTRGR